MNEFDPSRGFIIGRQMMMNEEIANMQDSINFANRALNEQQSQVNRAVDVIQSLRNELVELNNSQYSFEVGYNALRGVIRELLAEIRANDPSNPLLKKEIRDLVFDGYFDAYQKVTIKDDYKTRRLKAASRSDQIYGLTNSDKSGPDAEKITQNLPLRKARGIPETKQPQITSNDSAVANELAAMKRDQEKLINLVAALTSEIKTVKPDSAVITEASMKDTFETFALNEMEKSSAKKSNPG